MKRFFKKCWKLTVAATLISVIMIGGFMLSMRFRQTVQASQPAVNRFYGNLSTQVNAVISAQVMMNQAVAEKRETEIMPQRGFIKLDIPAVYILDAVIAYEDDSILIPSDNITSGFGYQDWRHGTHKGIDIGRSQGEPIYSAAVGVVKKVVTGCTHNYGKSSSCGCGGGYGNYIVIDHGDGLETLYGHCQAIYVEEGQEIKRNQQIAEVGSTGYSTGWHLHFEIHDNGVAINPFDYM